LHGLAEAVSCAGVGDLEGQYCPKAGHLRGGRAASGVAGQTWVAHAADGRVLIKPAGEFAGVALATVEAQGKSAQAAQREERLGRRPAGVAGRSSDLMGFSYRSLVRLSRGPPSPAGWLSGDAALVR
jgi:hypothetical protein